MYKSNNKMNNVLPYILIAVLHISTLSEGKSCGLSKKVGPCRFAEPCKPTLFSFNETFLVVSWEGLFVGCHDNQIKDMWMRGMRIISNGYSTVKFTKKIAFSSNEIYLEKKYCENASIALRIDFTADHMKVQNGSYRLDTHSNSCNNIITRSQDLVDYRGDMTIIYAVTIGNNLMRKQNLKNLWQTHFSSDGNTFTFIPR